MKVRQGFVSNSSSSSFIIGVGKIKDRSALKKLLPKSSYDCYCDILSTTALLNKNYHDYGVRGDWLTVIANVNSEPEVSIKFDPDGDDDYFVVNIGNNEGDQAFWRNDMGDLDYGRVNDEWFGGDQRKILEILKNKDLFHEVQYRIGVDRNG
ncbi:MAG: hypothetical protein GF411_08680 [Candidatus Lokiarchaeota archaeon]|nr:hypothetical protein [Candidatus Lokiarchaeota archaeon]